ncbi:hypothetical protein H2200_003831 [Cladophialophora chaetospira]|uniref:Clr5 domain-containing protein n=1 Tax=Cladophialophora chaetospira TaxID=386627 RepID=A0AA38XFR1_9EURO|nr:hypothetical protein H2200_003831 [Cladophialophora chaetospira]
MATTRPARTFIQQDPNNPRYSHRLSNEQWAALKPMIMESLYDGKAITTILADLRSTHHNITRSQLGTQLKKWKLFPPPESNRPFGTIINNDGEKDLVMDAFLNGNQQVEDFQPYPYESLNSEVKIPPATVGEDVARSLQELRPQVEREIPFQRHEDEVKASLASAGYAASICPSVAGLTLAPSCTSSLSSGFKSFKGVSVRIQNKKYESAATTHRNASSDAAMDEPHSDDLREYDSFRLKHRERLMAADGSLYSVHDRPPTPY